MTSLTFASLFSGCGGFDLGFTEAGYEPVAAFDSDQAAVTTYCQNVGPYSSLQDLALEPPKLSLLSNVDVLLAGPPCQGFSTAGHRNESDPRNHFLPLAAELAARTQPKVFLLENVPAAKAGKHVQYWQKAQAVLRSAGFTVSETVVRTELLGMPQARKRIILVAWRTHKTPTLTPQLRQASTVRQAFTGIESVPDHKPNPLSEGCLAAIIAPHIGEGQSLSNVRNGRHNVHSWDIPTAFGIATQQEKDFLHYLLRERRRRRIRTWGDADPVSEERIQKDWPNHYRELLDSLRRKKYVRQKHGGWDLTRTFNGKYRRLSWDKAAPTVHTKFGDPRHFLHPSEDRGFSVREAARLQGFPDTFIFHGTGPEKFRQIGNAVPPPVSYWLADSLKSLF